MHTLTVVLAAVLALALTAAGVPKIAKLASARDNAVHLNLPMNLSRGIGALEVAAAGGLLIGFVLPWLAIAAAIGVVLLMIGAVIAHARMKDPMPMMLPAIGYAMLAAAVLVLQLNY
jgi:uncharacterized membrane protein YkgB